MSYETADDIPLLLRGRIWDLWLKHYNTAEIGRELNIPERFVDEIKSQFTGRLYEAMRPPGKR